MIPLAWWPLQGASAEDMDVEVGHGLTREDAGVEYRAESLFSDAEHTRDFSDLEHEMRQQFCILLLGCGDVRNRSPRNQQHVLRRHRRYIPKSYAQLIFVHDVRRYFVFRYLFKECFLHLVYTFNTLAVPVQ